MQITEDLDSVFVQYVGESTHHNLSKDHTHALSLPFAAERLMNRLRRFYS